MLPHQAALAAGEQGRFWEMHDLLFRTQHQNSGLWLLEHLPKYAAELKLDEGALTSAIMSRRLKERVLRDREEGDRLGVSATPTYFINGQRFVGARTLPEFRALIDATLTAGANAPSGAPTP